MGKRNSKAYVLRVCLYRIMYNLHCVCLPANIVFNCVCVCVCVCECVCVYIRTGAHEGVCACMSHVCIHVWLCAEMCLVHQGCISLCYKPTDL